MSSKWTTEFEYEDDTYLVKYHVAKVKQLVAFDTYGDALNDLIRNSRSPLT